MPQLRLVPRVESALSESLQDFLLAKSAALRSPATLDLYGRCLRPFVAFLRAEGLTEPAQLKVMHVRAYLAGRARRNAPGTVSIHARVIRNWTRFLEREGYIERAPRFEQPRVREEMQPVPTAEELRALVKAASKPRDRALVLFLADTGSRRGEAAALTWGDLNLEMGTARLRRTKNGRPRVVVLGAHSRRALLRYRRGVPHGDGDPLWVTDDGRALGGNGIRNALLRLGKRAGVRVSPHGLRRFFATAAMANGMNVAHLGELLGHSDLTMLRKYALVHEDDLRTSHAAAAPVDRLLGGR